MTEIQNNPQFNIGFDSLNLLPEVLEAVIATGYEEPSPIQAKSIPLILEGHDLIGQAQTGTGKTAAFALPILCKINASKRVPQALILAPTRELALQVAEAFATYASKLPQIKVATIYGGAPMGSQLRAIGQGTQILVATPGRLCDHLRRNPKILSNINFLVLDEADEMLKLGFMDDLEQIFNAMPKERQTVLFSATLSATIRQIAERHLDNPKQVKIAAKTQTVESIEQSYLYVHNEQKTFAVLRLLEVESFDAVIAFVRTKQATLDLAAELEIAGYKVAALNGDIAQNQREKVIDSIKDGRIDIVVATDVAARGLDVPRITHVLNVDMPYDPESYVHRIGRTGRAGRAGRALLLVTPRERRMLQTIERVTKQKVTEIKLPEASQVLEARINKLSSMLGKLLNNAINSHGRLLEQLVADLDTDVNDLACAMLVKLTQGQSFDLASIERETPKMPNKSATTSIRSKNPRERRSNSGGRAPRERGFGNYKNMVRCRTDLGVNDGVAARNLLGAIINEGKVERSEIGKISVKDDFSVVELPKDNVDSILRKVKNTKIMGKPLKLRILNEK